MKKKLLVLLIVLALFIIIIQIPTVLGTSGIRVEPSYISYPDAHKGNTYSGKLKFFNMDDYYQSTISINLSGAIANWEIVFYHTNDLTNPIKSFISEKDTEDELFFVLTIPENIKVGLYQGNILLKRNKKPDVMVIVSVNINLEIYINIIADFSYNPINATTEDTIQFNDISKSLDETINTWFWDFGDGYNSYLQYPLYKYNSSGEYNVTLRVISSSDYVDEITKTILIQIPQNEESTNEQNGTNNNVEDKKDGSSGFELLPILLAIVLILFWKKNKV